MNEQGEEQAGGHPPYRRDESHPKRKAQHALSHEMLGRHGAARLVEVGQNPFLGLHKSRK